MKRVAIALPGLLLLTACKVGPDYTRPTASQQSLPETHRSLDKAESASFADAPWWDAFKDPALQSLIDEALKNASTLQIATARVEQARAQTGISKADYFPEINYGVGASRGKNFSPFGNLVTANQFNVQLGVSWEIDIWGRSRRYNEATRAQFMGSIQARRATMLSMVAELASDYFQLRGLDLQLDIAKRTAKTQQETLDLFNRRLLGGVSNKLETSRAEANLGQALATIPELERQIFQKENQICALLGRFPGPITRGNPLMEQGQAPQVPAGIPSALLERRPDVIAAEQQLVAANAQIGIAQANRFPQLNLSGLIGLANSDQSKLTDQSQSGIWGLTAGLVGPIFQGGRLTSIKEEREAAAQAARIEYQQTVLESFRETSNALQSRLKYEQVIQAQTRQVDALAQAAKLASERYQGGLSSYLDVLEAESTLFVSELSLAQARTAYTLSYVYIYKALGGGWQLGDDWSHSQATTKPAPAPAPAKP
jgi:multidrug efflux system outer membrane protein